MEQLYRNYWGDESCLSAAVDVLTLSVLIIGGVMLLIAVVAWLVMRRLPAADRWSNTHLLIYSFGGCAALLAFVAVYATFFNTVVRTVHVADGAFVIATCEGPRAAMIHIAAHDISSIDYRWRWSGGKTRRQIDEMVITPRTGGPIAVWLSTDPDVVNFPLLKRVAPADVIAQWIAARRERGWQIPPALAAIE